MKLLDQQSDTYVWTARPPVAPSRTFDGLNRDATYTAIAGYSANGDLTADGARTFAYDLENPLTHAGSAAGQSGATLDVTYDPLGRLSTTTATNGGATTLTGFLYDGDRPVGEYGSNGAPLRHYVHGPGVDEPLVWYEGATQTAPKFWLHADRQGSIIAASDAAGSLGGRIYTYGPYGEPNDWGPLRVRYTGQIAFQEAQLYHYKARVYDPILKPQFRAGGLLALKEVLASLGVKIESPPHRRS